MLTWLGFFLATAVLAQESSEVALFNGRDLTGWTHFLSGDAQRDDVWSVTDGVLICKGRPAGYIRTERDYTNFVLKLQWRFNPVTKQAGNSGVLFRMVGRDKVWPRSIEAQLQHRNAGDFWNIDKFPMKVDQRRTRGRNTRKLAMAEKPIGEWNEYEIRAEGGLIELRVNGQLLNRAYDAWETPGKICLQSEGAEIHFRNIRLTPLRSPPPGKIPQLSEQRFEPLYRSGILTEGVAEFDVQLADVEELWLLVLAGPDGNSCDWADWIDPVLHLSGGSSTSLLDVDWQTAITGWGQVRKNQNADGKPLSVHGDSIARGIGTHAQSAISYRLPKGRYERLTGRAALDDGGRLQDGGASVEFVIAADITEMAFYAATANDLFKGPQKDD